MMDSVWEITNFSPHCVIGRIHREILIIDTDEKFRLDCGVVFSFSSWQSARIQQLRKEHKLFVMLEEQHDVGPGEGCADFGLIPVTRRRIVTAAALLVARPLCVTMETSLA